MIRPLISSAVFLALLSLVGEVKGAEPKADLPVIIKRLSSALLPKTEEERTAVLTEARQSASQLLPNGSWNDISYTNRDPANWPTANHLSRVRTMARAISIAADQEKTPLRAASLRALDHWFEHKYKNPNWWWNEIGVPLTLGETCLLLGSVLDDARLSQADRTIDSARWDKLTGQNLVWMTKIRILRGCVLNREEIVRGAFDRLWREIFIASPRQEGIQADFSFHQHGNVLYAGGYGQGFTVDLAHLATCAEGTGFAMPEDRREIFSNYLLDGQQWMVRGTAWDYGVVGREITRPGKDARGLMAPLRELASLPWPRRSEFREFLQRMEGVVPALSGDRQFWMSDFHVHERPELMITVRMHSTRIDNTDSYTNGEGKRSHHIADGVTLILRNGEEYRDIFPCWDWRRLPGITCVQSAQPFNPVQVREHGATSFVGGVSDGRDGCAAMNFQRQGLSARKGWFFFDGVMLALGSGISYSGAEQVTTSLDQCIARGPVLVSNSAEALPDGPVRNIAGVRWVWHDGVAYVFPEPQRISVAHELRSGNWNEIGVVNRVERKKVFSLWLDHSSKPTDATYAYIVAPASNPARLREQAALPQILANTPEVQAVATKDSCEAVFWKPGAVNDGPLRFSVNQPSLVLMRLDQKTLRIAVANPENKGLQLKLRVNVPLRDHPRVDSGMTELTFELPNDIRAGSSLVDNFALGSVVTLEPAISP